METQTNFITNNLGKLTFAMAIGLTFFIIWANLAVGLIGAGAHWGNFMYLAVIAIVVIGSLSVRFKHSGMERVMYLAAISLVLIAIIAIIAGMGEYRGSSIGEIIGVNGFFGLAYGIIGALFGYIGRTPKELRSKN